MAVAVQTTSVLASASSASAVIVKPTGLAVGDLMLVQISTSSSATVSAVPTGFTLTTNTFIDDPDVGTSAIYWKIADAGDVAASTFTFTFSDTGSRGGAMYRIDGTHATIPVVASDKAIASNTDAPSFANGITPAANSLIVMFLHSKEVLGIGGYAIAVSTPTWTEAWETSIGAGGRFQTSAYGLRAAATGTGNSSVTGGIATFTDWVCQLVAVQPPITTAIKTVNGLAKASVKTVEGLAIASVKTKVGLA